MKLKPNLFTSQLILALYITCIVCISYILEHIVKLSPCPLCLIQRWFFIGIMLLSYLNLVKKRWLNLSLFSLIYLFTGVGLIIAGRHIWLQTLPEANVPSCTMSLEYMLENLPFKDIIALLFAGSGECHQSQWFFLGLTLPMWSFINYFIILIATTYSIKLYYK